MDTYDIAAMYTAGMSAMRIAKKIGRSLYYVQSRLKMLGVASRSVSEGVHLAKCVPAVEPTEGLLALLDGLLLGDAHIEAGAVGSRLVLVQTIAHESWVVQVRDALADFGVISSFSETKAGTTTIRGVEYRRNRGKGLKTRYYVFLTEQRRRWYPNGTKCIPKDVRLTPVSIAHWYFGDGCVGCKGYHAKFCTDAFPSNDVDILMERLHDTFGWEPVREQRNRILLCKMADRANLLEMIKDRTPECFRYKLALRTKSKLPPVTITSQ
jgi:hypothetical protein